MKPLLLFALPFLLCAQQPSLKVSDLQGAGVPSVNCSVGQRFFRTDATAGANVYLCTATNTWTAAGGGGGITGSGSTGQVPYWTSSSAQGGISGTSWDNTNRILQFQDANNNPNFLMTINPDASAANGGLIFLGQKIQPTAQTMGNGLDGGGVDLRGYSGGDTSDVAAFGGAGGLFVGRAGSGGDGGLGGGGGDANFRAGPGGIGSMGNGGNGGVIGFIAGSAGAGGDANGGDISFSPGSEQGAGTRGKVIVAGAFATDLGTCTAATLSAILTADGDMCFCTDCKVTTVSVNVVSNATCTGTGSGSMAIRIASTPKCQYLP